MEKKATGMVHKQEWGVCHLIYSSALHVTAPLSQDLLLSAFLLAARLGMLAFPIRSYLNLIEIQKQV